MQARGRHWRRTSRGLFVPASVNGELPEQRIVEAAAVLPAQGGVTGWAALRWAGGVWFDGLAVDGHSRLPVALATGDSSICAQPGIVISEERLNPADLTTLDGLPMTTLPRSVAFEMRYALGMRAAVAWFDMAAYSDLLSVEELVDYTGTAPREGLSGWTGMPQLRLALPYLDENVWSPREADMQLTWMIEAELPRPLINHPVFDRFGNHVGTPDLFDPEAGVVGDYNGALHLVGVQARRDRDREEAFRRVGLECFVVLSDDCGDPARLAARMHEARDRAKWAAPTRRDWTIDLPSWWVPTFTVDQRRNLDQRQRERWLRVRRRIA